MDRMLNAMDRLESTLLRIAVALEAIAKTGPEIRDTIKFMAVGDEDNSGPVERISMVLEGMQKDMRAA